MAPTSPIPRDKYPIAIGLSSPPQALFDLADGFLAHAGEIRVEAGHLQSHAKLLTERANLLTSTARGLQTITVQDQKGIELAFDQSMRDLKCDIAGPEPHPRDLTRLEVVQPRVEDGLATFDDVAAAFSDARRFGLDDRFTRSMTPEPDIVPILHSLSKPASTSSDLPFKRKFSSSEAGDDVLASSQEPPPSKKAKREAIPVRHELQDVPYRSIERDDTCVRDIPWDEESSDNSDEYSKGRNPCASEDTDEDMTDGGEDTSDAEARSMHDGCFKNSDDGETTDRDLEDDADEDDKTSLPESASPRESDDAD